MNLVESEMREIEGGLKLSRSKGAISMLGQFDTDNRDLPASASRTVTEGDGKEEERRRAEGIWVTVRLCLYLSPLFGISNAGT